MSVQNSTYHRSLDFTTGVACAVFGGVEIIRNGSFCKGGAALGFGTSLAQHAITAPDDVPYSHREAIKSGLMGAASSAIGSGVSSLNRNATVLPNLLCSITTNIALTSIKIKLETSEAPNKEKLYLIVASALAGTLTGTLARQGASLLGNATITGAISGATSSAASTVTTNYFSQKRLADNLGFAVLAGGFSGAIYATRAEIEKRQEREAKALANQAKLDAQKQTLLEKERALKQREQIALQKKAEALKNIEKSQGEALRAYLKRGGQFEDQRLNRSFEAVLEQLGWGHKLTCYINQQGHKCKAYLQDNSQQGHFTAVMHELEAIAREMVVLEAEHRVLYNEPVPPVDTKKFLLEQVSQQCRRQVEDLQAHGYRVVDRRLNGNIEAILEQLSYGHQITFLRTGRSPVYVSFVHPVNYPQETLLEASVLLVAIYQPTGLERDAVLYTHTPHLVQVRNARIGPWNFMLIHNRRTDEWSVVWHGVTGVRSGIQSAWHHARDPRGLFREMHAILDEWQRTSMNGASFATFFGHSHGLFLASRMQNRYYPHVRTVGVNGHSPLRGPNHINYRTDSDIVSRGPVSVASRSDTVMPGGHSMRDFRETVEHSDMQWGDHR